MDSSLIDKADKSSFPNSVYGSDFLEEEILHALKSSFFEFIVNRIHAGQFPNDNMEMLNYQHRMHPNIGRFVSESFYDGRTINTGTATGDLSADATSSVGLYATSTSGNATASFAEIAAGKSQVSAIVDSDVRAGSSGRNRVDAIAALDLLLNAKTVNGAATATGNSAVYGITDGFAPSTGGNSIQLAGDISAQARFSNTALARSVQGTATSTATNANVLGVNGYDLTVIGSGGLTGSAHGLMRADAGSVDGNAQAKALL
jgi:hypothetical protein